MCKSRSCCAATVAILYSFGLSHKEICEETGYKSSTVGSVISRRIGTKKTRGHVVRKKWGTIARDPDLLDAIEREYLAGASTYELGEKYGVDHGTVGRWMRQMGHTRGKGHGPAVDRHNEAMRAELVDWVESQGAEYVPWKKRRHYRIVSRTHEAKHITWQDIAECKGNMLCDICGEPCDPHDRTWGRIGPMYPSVDHIVRIVDGGADTFENTRLAHIACNMKASIDEDKRRGICRWRR